MYLPARVSLLFSSVLRLPSSPRFALALFFLLVFPLDLPAQTPHTLPASARELISLSSARTPSALRSRSLPFFAARIARSDLDAAAPPAAGILQNSRPSWRTERFHWKSGMLQGLFFLGIQHGVRMKQDKTRRELDGRFFVDWVDAVNGLQTWSDGGKAFTNYVAHPAQGAITGYLWVHNDPKSKYLQFSRDPGYWIGRMKAMAWTAVWSTQFEIGPISESSLGNVGQLPRTQGYVDLVITPILGTALILEEDLVDRYLVGWVERKTQKHGWRAAARSFFNPCRSVANLLRFRAPWYRDARTIDNVSTIPD